MELDPDFTELIECCGVHDVRFLIVGGYAVAAHGHPRFTSEADTVIQLGYPPKRIDLLTGIDGVAFEEC